MKKIIINDESFEFKLSNENNLIKVNNSSFEMKAISKNKFTLLKDGRIIQGNYLKSGNRIFIDIEGVVSEIYIGSGRKKSESIIGDATRLLSPMPGKVFKVLKKIGDVVKAGEGVIILEAMKMEHSLKVLKDSKIVSINFQEGDQVKSGQVMVNLEICE